MGSKSLFHNGRTYFYMLTNEGEREIAKLASQMYGEFYYALLLNLFHKNCFIKNG